MTVRVGIIMDPIAQIAFKKDSSLAMLLAGLVAGLVLNDIGPVLDIEFEPEKLPFPLRPFARAMGITAPDGKAPAYLRAVVRMGGTRAREAGRRLLATNPERVIFAHGKWFDRDAGARLERSLRWLTR